MNRTAFARKASTCAKVFCLAGLMTVPVTMASASSVSLTEVSGVYNLKAEDSTVKQVFDYIEKHSKYVFVYDQQVKNRLNEKVSINMKGKSNITEKLSNLPSPLSFSSWSIQSLIAFPSS